MASLTLGTGVHLGDAGLLQPAPMLSLTILSGMCSATDRRGEGEGREEDECQMVADNDGVCVAPAAQTRKSCNTLANMIGRIIAVVGITALATFGSTVSSVSQEVAASKVVAAQRLQEYIDRLKEIKQRMAALPEDEKISVATAQELQEWAEQFKIETHDSTLGRALTACGIGVGTSLGGEAIVTGGIAGITSALTASAGAMIAGYVDAGIQGIQNIGEWRNIDRNTAFYQWLVEYLEWGRQHDLDGNLLGFLEGNGALVEKVTGTPLPPLDATDTLKAYLSLYAIKLMTFIGHLEEVHGTKAFPRFKFGMQGRYGKNRYAVGYFRALIAVKLQEEINKLTDGLEKSYECLVVPDFLRPDEVIKRGSWANFVEVDHMSLHGQVYDLYVLQHPGCSGPTDVIYHLNSKATRLTGYIGIDQSMNPNDPIDDQPDVEYIVYTDGEEAWRSGIVTHKTATKRVDVDLNGVKELKLVVTSGGDDCFHDWAIWANPEIHLR